MFVTIKKKGLQPIYFGPFKVIKHYNKSYVINRNGKSNTDLIDRLKAVFVKNEEPSSIVDNDIYTRYRKKICTFHFDNCLELCHAILKWGYMRP